MVNLLLMGTRDRYLDELNRLQHDFAELKVGDTVTLVRLAPAIVNVVDMAIPDKKVAERFISVINGMQFVPMEFSLEGYGPAPGMRESWLEAQRHMHEVINGIKHHIEQFGSADTPIDSKSTTTKSRNKVFIVHGHDNEMLRDIEAYIRRVRVEAVVLQDEASRGDTIIQKVERYGDVPYAVVLLSPDDVGRARSAPDGDLRPRARQNAVLELGYFIGRLGRGNVAVILNEDDSGAVERPGDIDGVVYISYKDDWRTKLLREFRAAEIKHDASKA